MTEIVGLWRTVCRCVTSQTLMVYSRCTVQTKFFRLGPWSGTSKPPATPMNMVSSHLIFRFLRTCGRSKEMWAFSLLVLVSKYSYVLRSDLMIIVLILA